MMLKLVASDSTEPFSCVCHGAGKGTATPWWHGFNISDNGSWFSLSAPFLSGTPGLMSAPHCVPLPTGGGEVISVSMKQLTYLPSASLSHVMQTCCLLWMEWDWHPSHHGVNKTLDVWWTSVCDCLDILFLFKSRCCSPMLWWCWSPALKHRGFFPLFFWVLTLTLLLLAQLIWTEEMWCTVTGVHLWTFLLLPRWLPLAASQCHIGQF